MRQIVEDILKERYYQPGETCWEDIAERVANFVAKNPESGTAYYEAINNLELIPNSPALMNAGGNNPQCSACFSISVEDSIDSIFEGVKACAIIHKSGGGTGINFSKIRGKGEEVKGTGHMASGPVSFMRVFNEATETIKQGGKRRGANLGSLDVDHPDIKEFITCKSNEGTLSNFNISINITDDFMRNKDPEIWELIVDGNWKNGEPGIIFTDTAERDNKRPDLGKLEHTNPCVSGDTKITTKVYGDRPIADFVDEEIEIWNGFEWSLVTPKITGYEQPTIIVEVMQSFDSQTRNSIIRSICCTPYHKFVLENGDRIEAKDLINGLRLTPFYHQSGKLIKSEIHNIIDYKENSIAHKVYCLNEPKNNTFVANGVIVGNCGETRLLPWESCNLASINLMKCISDGMFDYQKFYSLVRLGVDFLNDMIDVNRYPLPQIEEATKKTRKIGLGVMGFADVLIALGMRYGDDDSLQFANDLFLNMRQVAEHESMSIGGNNAAVLSLAPTGTISLFAGVSSGIEPNFAYFYNRSTWASGEKVSYQEVHPMFEEHLKQLYDPQTRERIIDYAYENGSVVGCIDVMRNSELFVTAKDISPRDHIRMQATIQKHVDQAISKTVNCPESTTKEEISDLIKYAWESGCKGLTIYRENSRKDVVLETNATRNIEEVEEVKEEVKHEINIPREIDMKSIRLKSACGVLWVQTGFRIGSSEPVEVWVKAENGGCEGNLNFIGRLISKMLQEGVSHEVACRQGNKVFCSACVKNKNGDAEGYSCANLISKGIKEGIKRRKEDLNVCEIESTKQKNTKNPFLDVDRISKCFESVLDSSNMCPVCGAQLMRIEGCKTCTCGYSKCGG